MTDKAGQRQRRKKPELRAHDRAVVLARSAALTRLAKLHPVEYSELLNEERARRRLKAITPGARIVVHRTAVKREPLSKLTQQECTHPKDRKVQRPYGSFCAACGKRLS